MNNQNLLIYQLPYLWEIMSELEGYLNFKIIEISNQKKLNDQINLSPNYLILTKKQINLHLPPQKIRRIYVKLS